MPQYRIAVTPSQVNPHQNQFISSAHLFGIHTLDTCSAARLYFLEGELSASQLEMIAQQLLTDPITETFVIGDPAQEQNSVIEVTLQPGVTDPAAENLHRALRQWGIHTIQQTATGQRYVLTGALTAHDLHTLATTLFSNPVIQRHTLHQTIQPPFIAQQSSDGLVETIALRAASPTELMHISKERRLSLDIAEMQAIQAYYMRQEREPRDTELETLAQTWSEHCVHKTFRATIDFTDADGTHEIIHGLLNTYIRQATNTLHKEWVVSAFVDNAGIMRFDEQFDLAFKVETHNHPSALEPFGGANTGVGGVVRDILGVSARPIANTDILCFGDPDLPEAALLPGVLHPRRIQSGVIAGVEDYGNKMGIPTVNGAILYDPGYAANPLVFCGCVGILPRGSHRAQAQAGDLIVVLGGRTGRDGLRGATFSSMEMDTTTSEIASISVQIGHPIHEKQVLEVVLRARDAALYTAITDCGAGGLSSAVGEMGKDLGATVQLDQVPLKYPGLRPWEVWLSEAQERMVMAVPVQHWERLQAIAQGQDVEITRIGTFEHSGRLVLRDQARVVGDLEMHFLHEGIPTRHLVAAWQAPETQPDPAHTPDYNATLLELLAHPNIRSKEATVRLYDHEVQGGTVVKPFAGVDQHSPNDAAVVVPLDTRHQPDASDSIRGFVVSNGICPQFGRQDPYAMAWSAIDEAFRNLVAVGADPDQVALLDNFCWGNPSLPDRLGSLVLASKGCHDAAIAYGAPFISGKDSLNNEYADASGTRHAIPGTLLISAIGIVPDVRKTITSDLKHSGDLLYLVGETKPEFRQSHYYAVNGLSGGVVPQPNPQALTLFRILYGLIQQGTISACHDLSEGGLAVALSEMCIGGALGADVTLPTESVNALLFAESNTRFVISVQPDHQTSVEYALGSVGLLALGVVTGDTLLVKTGDATLISQSIKTLANAWGVPVTIPESLVELPVQSQRTIQRAITPKITAPRALIVHANGTNRDRDAALACELAGAQPVIAHMNQLRSGEISLREYQLLIVPGGFSYGDDLGAGQLWAQDLRHLSDDLTRFVAEGRPVLGICNGFQALIKAGLLPNADFASGSARQATLTNNAQGHFECRWVTLQPNPTSTSLFTDGLTEPIFCPVAHGEGNVTIRDVETLRTLWDNGNIALHYTDESGLIAGYPYNPNGSVWNIAAVCNDAGNVMGLMPHPENHIFPWQNPRYHRFETRYSGLVLFQNAVKFA